MTKKQQLLKWYRKFAQVQDVFLDDFENNHYYLPIYATKGIFVLMSPPISVSGKSYTYTSDLLFQPEIYFYFEEMLAFFEPTHVPFVEMQQHTSTSDIVTKMLQTYNRMDLPIAWKVGISSAPNRDFFNQYQDIIVSASSKSQQIALEIDSLEKYYNFGMQMKAEGRLDWRTSKKSTLLFLKAYVKANDYENCYQQAVNEIEALRKMTELELVYFEYDPLIDQKLKIDKMKKLHGTEPYSISFQLQALQSLKSRLDATYYYNPNHNPQPVLPCDNEIWFNAKTFWNQYYTRVANSALEGFTDFDGIKVTSTQRHALANMINKGDLDQETDARLRSKYAAFEKYGQIVLPQIEELYKSL
jgi:hypothetical protein